MFPCTVKFPPTLTFFLTPVPPAVTIEPVVFDEESVVSVTFTLPATDKSSPSAVFPVVVMLPFT